MDVQRDEGVCKPDWLNAEMLVGAQPSFLPSGWLVRISVFDRVGLFDTSYRYGCDSDWLSRARDAGVVSHMLPDGLFHWRIHTTNASYQHELMRTEMLRALQGSLARKRIGVAKAGARA
ncbi:MAG: hypothetical protein LC737_03590 [Chloroflexi bacterium]|nr:hypothetical protein [Chloroflexota bacterium]